MNSICSNCQETNRLLLCNNALTIGSLPTYTNTDVIVVFENNATDRVTRIPVTTNGAGQITINNFTDWELMPDQPYTVWVSLANSTDAETPKMVTTADGNYECFTVRFIRPYTTNQIVASHSGQTLKIKS